MFKNIGYSIMAKVFKEAGNRVEKTNWMTKILDRCFEVKFMSDKKSWDRFLDVVDGIVEDAKDEIKQARKWVI